MRRKDILIPCVLEMNSIYDNKIAPHLIRLMQMMRFYYNKSLGSKYLATEHRCFKINNFTRI